MPILTPVQAGEIAKGVYDLRLNSVSDALKTGIGTDGLFAIDDGSAFKGTSGALMFRKLSTFGYIARGIGPFNTEVLIATGYTVLVYSIADNVRLLRRALAGGAAGVARKADPITDTLASIEAVAAGQMVLSQEILGLIEGDQSYVAANLGPREREVLALYTGGMEVTYDHHMYKAKWWTQGETPGHADVWADEGPCT